MGCSSFFMVMCRLLKVLHASSQKNCFCVLSALQKKSPRVKILSACSPLKKKFPYAWILSFIYKATHSLWNILFPFFLRARGYGKSIMCGSLGDFPKDAAVSCLVSD